MLNFGNLVCIDFETTGLNAWEPDFRVLSIAASWFVGDPDQEQTQTFFTKGEEPTRVFLKMLSDAQIPLLAHNVGFELLVIKCRFPELNLNLKYDSMRLSQLMGGANEMGQGFGLDDSLARHRPDLIGHKQKFYDHLKQKVADAQSTGTLTEKTWAPDDNGKDQRLAIIDEEGERVWLEEGIENDEAISFNGTWETKTVTKEVKLTNKSLMKYVHLADDKALEEYNVGDTDCTLKLARFIANQFAFEKYNWETDHELFMSMAHLITDAQVRGIKVDREALQKYVEDVTQEVAEIDQVFFKEFDEPIMAVRQALKVKAQSKFKKKIVEELPEFNITSKTHMEALCVDQLDLARKVFLKEGMEDALVPKWFKMVPGEHGKEHGPELLVTPKNSPSFRSAHMHQWGRPGEIIQNRGKRLLVKTQTAKLLSLSEGDGFWHQGLRLCGTVTGRYAGGGGLNCQALVRRDKGFMSALLPSNPDNILISLDIGSGEPSCTSEFTKDKVYTYCVFDGVGKAPFYANDMLYIDDIYLASLSFAPFGAKVMRDAFNADWDGLTFQEQWLKDPEVIKNKLKKLRTITKTCVLAIGYSAGAAKIHKSITEAGFNIPFEQIQTFWYRYWEVFHGIKSYAEAQKRHVERHGVIVTPLGYRGTPEPRKAYNFVIQSTVNPIIQNFTRFLLEEAPYTKFVTIIHDEVIIECPKVRLEDCRKAKEIAQDRVNAWLKWSLNMRFGFAVGDNFYEAK